MKLKEPLKIQIKNICRTLNPFRRHMSNYYATHTSLVQSSTTREKSDNDEVASIIDKAKSDNFIHWLQLSPNIRCVLADNAQILDIKDFCCGIRNFSVQGIDTRCHISKKFYFTPTTYRHHRLLD